METQELIRNLELEYWAVRAANPDWNMTLYDFLQSRGVADEDIQDYSPEIGEESGKEAN